MPIVKAENKLYKAVVRGYSFKVKQLRIGRDGLGPLGVWLDRSYNMYWIAGHEFKAFQHHDRNGNHVAPIIKLLEKFYNE